MECTIIYVDIQKDIVHKTVKQVALLACGEFERRIIERDVITGAWLTAIHTHDNGMMLSPNEWRDGCFLRYARTPPKSTPNLRQMWWHILSKVRQHM